MTLPQGNLSPALEVGRRVGIAGVAALLGGVLVLGAGGRLAMRLSGAIAIVNDPHTRFMLTGDGFRIGRISLDGTVGLILFGGVFGAMIAAAYWALLKDRMPARGRVWLGALAAAAIGGNALVHPDNIDFVILEPVAMNVALYPALAGLAGATIVGIDGVLTRRRFGAGPVGSVLLVSFAAIGVALVGALTLVSLGDEPVMALELISLAAVAVPVWIGQASRWAPPSWVVRMGPVVAVAVVVIEWTRLIASAVEILGPA